MKVWLDDLRAVPPGFDQHARTAAKAIALLETGAVRLILRGHDLGEAQNGTRYDVAKWVAARAFAWGHGETTDLPPLQWKIHSKIQWDWRT